MRALRSRRARHFTVSGAELTTYTGRPSFVPWLLPLLSQLPLGSAFPVTQQGVISKLTDIQGSRGAVASESSICSKIGVETVAMGVGLLR